jgi:hypothetical protein
MSVATGNGIIFKKVYNFQKNDRFSAGAECVVGAGSVQERKMTPNIAFGGLRVRSK